MKKAYCFIALVCGAMSMSSCLFWEPAYDFCYSRQVLFVQNETDIPMVVMLKTPTGKLDTVSDTQVSPNRIMADDGWTELIYVIEPHCYPQKIAKLKGGYDIWPDSYFKKYSCQMIDYKPKFQIGYVQVFNLADTTMINSGCDPDVSFFDYDTVYFDESYKQQPGGMLIHNLFLVIDHSTLRSMKKDTTMLSRFPEYYGR